MHVYARFHCICPCPVPCKGCLGWHSFSLSCVVQDCLTNNDYELIWRALLCTWPVAPVAPVALPARLGTCVFLQEQWFGTRNHLQSLQSKGKHTSYHILSKCLSKCLIMFDNVWYLHGSDSFNSTDILGWRSLLSSADRKDYLTCGICGEHLAGSSAMMQWLPPASTCSVVSNRQIRQYNLCCHDLSMLIMIWFRKICQCCQRARFDDIWLLELILAESKDQ